VLSVKHELSVGVTTCTEGDVQTKARHIYRSLISAKMSPCHHYPALEFEVGLAVQVGRRPTIWLGHSLGCLLIKEVLRIDEEERKAPGFGETPLSSRLKGVLFFGAPHLVSRRITESESTDILGRCGCTSSSRLQSVCVRLPSNIHIVSEPSCALPGKPNTP
jgi:hypothetical protein